MRLASLKIQDPLNVALSPEMTLNSTGAYSAMLKTANVDHARAAKKQIATRLILGRVVPKSKYRHLCTQLSDPADRELGSLFSRRTGRIRCTSGLISMYEFGNILDNVPYSNFREQ